MYSIKTFFTKTKLKSAFLVLNKLFALLVKIEIKKNVKNYV